MAIARPALNPVQQLPVPPAPPLDRYFPTVSVSSTVPEHPISTLPMEAANHATHLVPPAPVPLHLPAHPVRRGLAIRSS